MKLLTHNMLACHIRGVKNNFPFSIEVIKTEVVDADFNPGLLIRIIPVWRAPCILDFGVMTEPSHSSAWLVHRLHATHLPPDNLASVPARSYTGVRLCPCSETRIRQRSQLSGPTEDTIFVLLPYGM